MGLDMYLTASRYVSGMRDTDKTAFAQILGGAGLTEDDVSLASYPHLEIAVSVGYWRKANAIHQWFVDHVQSGKDNCEKFAVTREQLITLRALCLTVLQTENVEAAGQDVLPTQSGFFFGSTAYDDGYIADLRLTTEIIDKALSSRFDGWEFTYQSSW